MDLGTEDARELLAFYLDAGADALLGEEPVDRMAEEAPPPPVALPSPNRRDAAAESLAREPFARKTLTPPEKTPRARPAAPASPEAAAMAAREAARSAATLEDLR